MCRATHASTAARWIGPAAGPRPAAKSTLSQSPKSSIAVIAWYRPTREHASVACASCTTSTSKEGSSPSSPRDTEITFTYPPSAIRVASSSPTNERQRWTVPRYLS